MLLVRSHTRLPVARLFRLRPLSLLRRWRAVARQRADLGGLDDAALADVGLTREAAQAEAARPFWDAPDTWRL